MNITDRLDRFLHDDRQLHGLKDYLEGFLSVYIHPNNTRIHVHKRQLLDGKRHMDDFLPVRGPTTSKNLVLKRTYEDLSIMAVFLQKMENYETDYDNGEYTGRLSQFLHHIASVQCRLAQMMVSAEIRIPHVSRDVIAYYSDLRSQKIRHVFGYMVIRDSIRRLKQIVVDFDQSAWVVQEALVNFAPTPAHYSENVISQSVKKVSQNPRSAVDRKTVIGLSVAFVALILLLIGVCTLKYYCARGNAVFPKKAQRVDV